MRFARRFVLCLIAAATVSSPLSAAEVGTAFTYQGVLENPPGNPLNDTCAFEFALCDDAVAACSPATVSSHPAVAVTDGLFTVPDVDFGDDACNGEARWMAISVRCSGDAGFVSLSPRVELKPAPYALRAGSGVGGPNALNVTPDGKVGIGTNAPAANLHVAGDVRVDGALQAGSISSDIPLQIQTDGTTRVYIDDASGAVGIGTSGPFKPGPDTFAFRQAILPSQRSGFSCAADPSSEEIYCFGGWLWIEQQPTDQIFRFDPATDQVTVITSVLPTGRSNLSCVWSDTTERIYCFGGYNGGPYLDQIVSFEPVSGSVTVQAAVLPTGGSGNSCAIDTGTGKIYCFGGYNNPGNPFKIVEYDPTLDAIGVKSAILPSGTNGVVCTSGPPGKLYCVVTGSPGPAQRWSKIIEYTPATDALVVVPANYPFESYSYICTWSPTSGNVLCFVWEYTFPDHNEVVRIDPSTLIATRSIKLPEAIGSSSCAGNSTGSIFCLGSIRVAEFRDGPSTTLLQVGNPGDGSGAMANSWSVFSSRTFKRDIRSLVPGEYSDILEKILTTNVVHYSYTHDRRSVSHLGVIAEDSPREILTPDRKGVSLGDYNAFLLAGVKALQLDLQKKGNEIENLKSEISDLREMVKGLNEKQKVESAKQK